MSDEVLRWPAGPEMEALIQRYYGGEAALWEAIRSGVDAELRRRGRVPGPFHFRLRQRPDDHWEVLVTPAQE